LLAAAEAVQDTCLVMVRLPSFMLAAVVVQVEHGCFLHNLFLQIKQLPLVLVVDLQQMVLILLLAQQVTLVAVEEEVLEDYLAAMAVLVVVEVLQKVALLLLVLALADKVLQVVTLLIMLITLVEVAVLAQ
jgi:hypothetical protein